MSADAQHVSVDELADAAEDLLPAERATAVQKHVAACADCAALAAALVDTCATLANDPVPAMPDDVFARLQAVVDAESQRRATGADQAEDAIARSNAAKRTALGSFGQNPAYGSKVVGACDNDEAAPTR